MQANISSENKQLKLELISLKTYIENLNSAHSKELDQSAKAAVELELKLDSKNLELAHFKESALNNASETIQSYNNLVDILNTRKVDYDATIDSFLIHIEKLKEENERLSEMILSNTIAYDPFHSFLISACRSDSSVMNSSENQSPILSNINRKNSINSLHLKKNTKHLSFSEDTQPKLPTSIAFKNSRMNSHDNVEESSTKDSLNIFLQSAINSNSSLKSDSSTNYYNKQQSSAEIICSAFDDTFTPLFKEMLNFESEFKNSFACALDELKVKDFVPEVSFLSAMAFKAMQYEKYGGSSNGSTSSQMELFASKCELYLKSRDNGLNSDSSKEGSIVNIEKSNERSRTSIRPTYTRSKLSNSTNVFNHLN